jgi:hypothetical protein
VVVLVIHVFVFTVFCIVCTVFSVLFHLYIFLFVVSVLVYGLLPPSDNLIAVSSSSSRSSSSSSNIRYTNIVGNELTSLNYQTYYMCSVSDFSLHIGSRH